VIVEYTDSRLYCIDFIKKQKNLNTNHSNLSSFFELIIFLSFLEISDWIYNFEIARSKQFSTRTLFLLKERRFAFHKQIVLVKNELLKRSSNPWNANRLFKLMVKDSNPLVALPFHFF
jgi:hypothetical protein